MIHAVIHKKTSRWLKESNLVNSAPNRIPREDEITSTIFGPLCYFPAKYVYFFITSLIGNNSPDFDNLSIDNLSIKFWPSKIHTYRGMKKRTEPDIVFDFSLNGKKEIYIFELKWGASFGEDQIEREWESFRSKNKNGTSYLLYIAHNIENFNVLKARKNKYWKGLKWIDFLKKTKKIRNKIDNLEFNSYIEDLISLLAVFNFKTFDSFSHINLNNDLINSYIYQKINFKINKFYIHWRV